MELYQADNSIQVKTWVAQFGLRSTNEWMNKMIFNDYISSIWVNNDVFQKRHSMEIMGTVMSRIWEWNETA